MKSIYRPLLLTVDTTTKGETSSTSNFLRSPSSGQFRVVSARDIKTAFSFLDKDAPDVILLELIDPRGLDVFIALRDRAEHLPIIIVTSDDDIHWGEAALRAGAEDWMEAHRSSTTDICRALRFALARRRRKPAHKKQEQIGEDKTTNLVDPIDDQTRKKIEHRIRQTQKMEAIGTLAGGVAHDINNVLGSVMGLASVLQTDLGPNDFRHQDATDIVSACRRGRNLTRNLLGFARKGKYRKETIFLQDVVEQVAGVLSPSIPKGVSIQTELSNDLGPIVGDPGQLEHALLNLCANAIDAMCGKGYLSISTSNATLSELDVMPYNGVRPGHYVRLEVSDTGLGMDAETLERAFEPFFTTKPKGEGPGLGLSMVYGTIKNHGGVIWLRSTPGQGTTIEIYLPILGERHPTPPKGIPAARPHASSSESQRTVLLVDDEEMVRISSRRMLEHFHFNVLTAEHGAEAVEMVRNHHEKISLVILDMIMPIMDGYATFKAVREIEPNMPILLCSGFAKEEKAEKLTSEGTTIFLQKPFGINSLERALKEIGAAYPQVDKD